jgi:hypothetical protein
MFSCVTITPFGISRRPRRVLEKQNLRSAVERFRPKSYPRSLPSRSTEDRKCSRRRRRMPRLRFWRDSSSEIRGSPCSLKHRPPGNPLRCGPFCTGRLEAARTGGIDGNGDQSRAHAAKKRADHFEARRVGEQKPVLRRETMLFPQVSGDRLRPGGETTRRSSFRSDCRSGQGTNREVCAGAHPPAVQLV